jgi:ubiquinone/menaquinone biosynthesis C-methylase UbiE
MASLSTVPAARRVAITNEKITGPPAAEMLRRSGIADVHGFVDVLDNATGAGILVHELLKLATQRNDKLKINRIVSGDLDDTMLGFANEAKREALDAGLEEWRDVELTKIDQQAIPLSDESLTHVFANFGIFFCPNDEKALQEAYRVLKSGGTVGITSWKAIAWWPEVAQPAIKQFIPDAPELPSPSGLFPSQGWSDPNAIPAKLEKAGFIDVQTSEYKFTPDVEADEFAEATAVLVRIGMKRLWSGEDFDKYADQMQSALLKYLQENYENGRWSGKMTAIITLGNKA